MTPTVTLSLADIAKLAHVERPVVSMWRRREKDGIRFPSQRPDGRFDGVEIVDWLERTGRGNNLEARADLAVHAATTADADPTHLQDILALLAARALLDQPLSSCERDDLLDVVDELDPDNDFLLGEIEAIDPHSLSSLAAEADAVADAAWHDRAAYERVHDSLLRTAATHDQRLHPLLLEAVAAIAASRLRDGGFVVDIDGACADVVTALTADEDTPLPAVAIAQTVQHARHREVVRRYRAHGIVPRLLPLDGDWPPATPTVVLVRLSSNPEEAFDLLDEVTLQLTEISCALVIGPASLLTDALSHQIANRRRDALLRSGSVRAVVRLPQGLTRGGSREHLAFWLTTKAGPGPMWVADMSGSTFDRAARQSLVDDLLATLGPQRLRAYALLEPVDRQRLVAENSSLIIRGTSSSHRYAPDPADDAARIQHLRSVLARPLPDPFPYAPVSAQHSTAHTLTVGDARRQRMLRILPGARLPVLESGATRLWTADAVATRAPMSVDLLQLTTAVANLRLSQPGDVIFTAHGKPAAVVDADGGSAVAYPARTLRVTSPQLAPGAVADAINRVPQGNAKWQTWPIPLLQIARSDADDILDHLDRLEVELRSRQAQADELRRLITRSVLSGAVTVNRFTHINEKGP